MILVIRNYSKILGITPSLTLFLTNATLLGVRNMELYIFFFASYSSHIFRISSKKRTSTFVFSLTPNLLSFYLSNMLLMEPRHVE